MPREHGPAEVTTEERPKARVLLADDEQPIVAILSEVLRGAGYHVTGVNKPAEALALDAADFDVLLTDLKMPEMDGFELFDRLRERNRRLVGVMITGFGNLSVAQTAMRRGFSGILLKPFPLDRVTLTLQRAVAQQQLLAENERLSAILEMQSLHQHLRQARSRDELAQILARLAAELVHADTACVLLTMPGDAQLTRPESDDSLPAPAWTGALLAAGVDPSAPLRVETVGAELRLHVPVSCDDQAEGLLLLGLAQRTVDAVTLQRLVLLAQQAGPAFSHLRLFEARLREQKLALVGQMAGAICERVRRPLEHIATAVRDLPADDDIYVPMIHEETERIDTMCTELSDLVLGTDSLRPEQLDLAALVTRLARRVESDFARSSVRVEVDVRTPAACLADERKLSRALFNLLKNGVEAMPNGGVLTLVLDRQDGCALLAVSDTGCGMSPEVQARIFEPFYTRGKARGTGLGGAVVLNAVAAHGGTVEIDSEVGRGTTFTIRLPLH